jgi:ubiquinol-cytochrome c reductase cytochrome c1 subunit
MMIKKIMVFFICLTLVLETHGVIANVINMHPIPIDLSNKPRLQRGAKLFMNYCSGCHSLKYMRYSRMAEDLGLTNKNGNIEIKLLNNLNFTQANPYDPIETAMPAEDAKQWFGGVPPDLSLSARQRGPVWLYNYLKSFYQDNTKIFGVNNLLVPNSAMPDVLEPLLGQMILVPNKKTHISSLLLVKQGEMPPTQIDSALQDLVTFLVYVGEPAQLIRYRLGLFVIIFFSILFIVVYLLYRNYWRNLKR